MAEIVSRKKAKARRRRPSRKISRRAARRGGLANHKKKSRAVAPRRRRRAGNPPYGYGASTGVTWNRKRNPAASEIGTAPTLYVSGAGALQYPRGRLRAAPDGHGVYLDLGGAAAPRQGARVTRVDYDDPVKAVEAYKRIDRFRHDCVEPFIVGPAQNGTVLLTTKAIAWRKE